MRFHYHINTLIYLLHLLSLGKSLVYSSSDILYNDCSEDVRGKYSSGKYIMKNFRNSQETFRAKMACSLKKLYDITLDQKFI